MGVDADMIRCIIMALMLNACTTSPAVMNIRDFTLNDLRQAEAMASGDPLAAPCYALLIRVVESGQLSQVVGMVSAFQLKRNLRRSDDLKVACGGLLIDEQQMIARLGMLAAGGL